MHHPSHSEPLGDLKPFQSSTMDTLEIRLFGSKLKASKAPSLQNAIYRILGLNWNYEISETTDAKVFKSFLKQDNVLGCAVTMPNKVNFSKEVDILDDIGETLGSINTVYKRRNKSGNVVTVGTNTDTLGVYYSFLNNNDVKNTLVSEGKGNPGLVYGGGGAARSAVYALGVLLECSIIYIINRDSEEVRLLKNALNERGFQKEIIHVKDLKMAADLECPHLAVLCVPDIQPSTPEEVLAREVLDFFITNCKGTVLEMCYNPRIRTALYNDFEKNGWKVIDGTIAMLYQGLAQISIWGEFRFEDLPFDEAKQILDSIISHG